MKLLSVNYMNGYKVNNYATKITKEEEEEIVSNIYKILTKDDKIENKEVM